ncbi:MAG TPA: bifunctional precorrin-2 dehydrogenase/sirohydrochlorin ferrochelatase [Gemmatimonadaceae bacterium]
MSGVPILVEASGLRVLVVGGGAVATRKAKQFAQAGAVVRIVAPKLDEELEHLVVERGLAVERRPYESADIGDAQLIIAATDDRTVNADVARDADAGSRLLNAADHSDDGNFAMMAAHRRGPLTIGVSAGGVPAAAVRIRDALAERFDARYGDALSDLSALRKRMIASGEAHRWREKSPELIDAEFCDAVERGQLSERLAEWP